MPIKDIMQPDMIFISEYIRIRKTNKNEWVKALEWYKDQEIMYYSEGIIDRAYGLKEIKRMYKYLSNIGELYFIEILEDNKWKTIGDVTLSETNFPIVIGEKKDRSFSYEMDLQLIAFVDNSKRDQREDCYHNT